MTIPTIGPKGGAGDSGAGERGQPLTNAQVGKTLLGILLVGALLPPVTVLLWRLALSIG